ncbi:heat shock factor-binding protein 1-like protein 1 isoform X1 [Anolis carolinensis]|uniref:heat shock factor-binding protein 1-like protein 1 isoform X1 n=1 Tax=Anolis carolinensis TaxID=28377 RepID=UPI002F2B1B2C
MADGNDPQSARELSQFAENLLQHLQENFQALIDKTKLRMDEMGERIDDLEEHVTGLMTQAGIENAGEEIMAPNSPIMHEKNVMSIKWEESILQSTFARKDLHCLATLPVLCVLNSNQCIPGEQVLRSFQQSTRI